MLKCIHQSGSVLKYGRTRTHLASSHFKTLKKIKEERRKTPAVFCRRYFFHGSETRRRNERRRSASALYADFRPFEAKCLWQKLSSRYYDDDDDTCVLASGLFLASKTNRMARFGTTSSWMVNERSRWLCGLSLLRVWFATLFGRR